MSGCCSGAGGCSATANGRRYRLVLWAALAMNAAMFLVEVVAGVVGGSTSLQADALDFLGDAANYGISLLVLGASLSRRARAAMVKGASMGAFGLWVLGTTAHDILFGGIPKAEVMGMVGVLALCVNVAVAAMLYAYREGDSNMRSVWICSRNDAIGNVAVMAAAGGVFLTSARWPDAVVAVAMAALALSGAVHVCRRAALDLEAEAVVPAE